MKHTCGAIIPDESTFCNTCGKKIVYDGLTTKLDIPEYTNKPNPTASGSPYQPQNNVTRYVLWMESLAGKADTIVIYLSEEQKESLLDDLMNQHFMAIKITDERGTPHILRRGFIENVHIKLYPHPQGNR